MGGLAGLEGVDAWGGGGEFVCCAGEWGAFCFWVGVGGGGRGGDGVFWRC